MSLSSRLLSRAFVAWKAAESRRAALNAARQSERDNLETASFAHAKRIMALQTWRLWRRAMERSRSVRLSSETCLADVSSNRSEVIDAFVARMVVQLPKEIPPKSQPVTTIPVEPRKTTTVPVSFKGMTQRAKDLEMCRRQRADDSLLSKYISKLLSEELDRLRERARRVAHMAHQQKVRLSRCISKLTIKSS